jgi:hypothetical protein
MTAELHIASFKAALKGGKSLEAFKDLKQKSSKTAAKSTKPVPSGAEAEHKAEKKIFVAGPASEAKVWPITPSSIFSRATAPI